MNGIKVYLAEFIGTFFLCFAGIAAILSTQEPINSGAGLLGIALAHGLALSIAVSLFGGVSGAHFNPAVTCGMLVTGRIKLLNAIGYLLSQCLAGVMAATVCAYAFPPQTVGDALLGIPLPPPPTPEFTIAPTTVLIVEGIMTFLLVTAVFGTTVDERGKAVNIGGFAIGLTVAMNILAAGAITGASMNPARSFGPTFVFWLGARGENIDLELWSLHWLYWVGPILGGIAAALVYHHIILKEDE